LWKPQNKIGKLFVRKQVKAEIFGNTSRNTLLLVLGPSFYKKLIQTDLIIRTVLYWQNVVPTAFFNLKFSLSDQMKLP